MAHWFHRNPYKATASQKFDVSKISIKSDFLKVIYNLRDAREEFLQILPQSVNTPEKLDSVAEKYFSLIQGLFEVPDLTQTSAPQVKDETNTQKSDQKASGPPTPAGKAQILNSYFLFKWSQSLHVNKPALSEASAKFDMVNMAVNFGLWYSKLAAKLAAQSEVNMEDAKKIHTYLRKAAGIFKEIRDNQLSLVCEVCPKTSDLDRSILDAYIFSCQAEAQEVTIARAVEKKHTAKLIAGLANETSKLFQQADDVLKTREPAVVLKWRKYLQLKEAFYKSYALCYYGVSLLDQEKCGDSVRVLQESVELFEKTNKLCTEYRQATGAGSTIRPDEHPFYINYRKEMMRRFEKSKSENGFIYHQKVPPVAPTMDVQATHGLVDPIEYNIPSKSVVWNQTVYGGFYITKNLDQDKTSSPQRDSPLAPIKEPDIKVTKEGCTIS